MDTPDPLTAQIPYVAVSFGAIGQESVCLEGQWHGSAGEKEDRLEVSNLTTATMGEGEEQMSHGAFIDQALLPKLPREQRANGQVLLGVDITRSTPVLCSLLARKKWEFEAIQIADEDSCKNRDHSLFFDGEISNIPREGLAMIVRLLLHYDKLTFHEGREEPRKLGDALKRGNLKTDDPRWAALATMCWQISQSGPHGIPFMF